MPLHEFDNDKHLRIRRKTIEIDIKLRDRWDCLVECLRDPLGPCGVSKSEIIEYLHDDEKLASESWLEKWMVPKAGLFNAENPIDMLHKFKRLKHIIVTQAKRKPLSMDSATFKSHYRKYINKFYLRAYSMPDRGFTFVGRENELGWIRRYFATGKSVVTLSGGKRNATTALKGFGGQGKTAIAYQYAIQSRNNYSGIVWINAEDLNFKGSIEKFIQAHCNRQDTPAGKFVGDGELSDYFKWMAEVLRGRILLILDNIPFIKSDEEFNVETRRRVAEFLDATPPFLAARYDFLITSRRELLPDRIVNMPIDRLTTEDAVALFKARTDRNELKRDNTSLVRLVDEILGGHALSITLIASLANQQNIHDINGLIKIVERKIVDAEALESFDLGEEYPKSLYASFLASYDALTRDAQYLLLTFALFRRGELAIETLRGCVRKIPANAKGPATKAISRDLDRAGGRHPMLDRLVAHSLVERVDWDWRDGLDKEIRSTLEQKSIRSQKGRRGPIQISLHEVIYDFVTAQWASSIKQAEHAEALHDLEIRLTEGACAYASEKIEREQIEFLDIETLTGFLMPIVREDRGIIPSDARIRTALSFWFEYFKFQNFVYDTGLQELLIGQMKELEEYLKRIRFDDDRFFLLMRKLIGHAHYADPLGRGGKEADICFNEALTIAERIKDDPRYRRQKREIQWYKIFVLSHRSNLASKRRPKSELHLDIWEDASVASDLHEIEATLPATLKSLDAAPTIDECELLVRAAIYWGHRGNQDNYILFSRINRRDIGKNWNSIVANARHFYTLAANYRLLALRIFRQGNFDRRVAKFIRNSSVPHVASWILNVDPAASREFETFTSFSQAIGDTAHQYRGLHFVNVLAYLASKSASQRIEIITECRKDIAAARLLWDISRNALKPGEVMLKYQLWMASSNAFEEMIESLENRNDLANFEHYLDVCNEHIADVQKQAKSKYNFSIDEQQRQLKSIYDFITSAPDEIE